MEWDEFFTFVVEDEEKQTLNVALVVEGSGELLGQTRVSLSDLKHGSHPAAIPLFVQDPSNLWPGRNGTCRSLV